MSLQSPSAPVGGGVSLRDTVRVPLLGALLLLSVLVSSSVWAHGVHDDDGGGGGNDDETDTNEAVAAAAAGLLRLQGNGDTVLWSLPQSALIRGDLSPDLSASMAGLYLLRRESLFLRNAAAQGSPVASDRSIRGLRFVGHRIVDASGTPVRTDLGAPDSLVSLNLADPQKMEYLSAKVKRIPLPSADFTVSMAGVRGCSSMVVVVHVHEDGSVDLHRTDDFGFEDGSSGGGENEGCGIGAVQRAQLVRKSNSQLDEGADEASLYGDVLIPDPPVWGFREQAASGTTHRTTHRKASDSCFEETVGLPLYVYMDSAFAASIPGGDESVERFALSLLATADVPLRRAFRIRLLVNDILIIRDDDTGPLQILNTCSDSIEDRLFALSFFRGQDGQAAGAYLLLTNCYRSGTVGLAWLGTVCMSGSAQAGTGAACRASSGRCVANTAVASRTAGSAGDWIVIAHELGHVFGATHGTGIMSSQLDRSATDFDDMARTEVCDLFGDIWDAGAACHVSVPFGPFDTPCAVPEDCLSGLVCQRGSCTAPCETTEDCNFVGDACALSGCVSGFCRDMNFCFSGCIEEVGNTCCHGECRNSQGEVVTAPLDWVLIVLIVLSFLVVFAIIAYGRHK